MIIRPLEDRDAPLYRDLLASLSERDRYLRFFHHISTIGEAEVVPFVIPEQNMIGMIAEENGVALGAAHAFITPNGEAELAIVVRPGVRHQGIGTKLVAAVNAILRDRGIRTVVAHSLF